MRLEKVKLCLFSICFALQSWLTSVSMEYSTHSHHDYIYGVNNF